MQDELSLQRETARQLAVALVELSGVVHQASLQLGAATTALMVLVELGAPVDLVKLAAAKELCMDVFLLLSESKEGANWPG